MVLIKNKVNTQTKSTKFRSVNNLQAMRDGARFQMLREGGEGEGSCLYVFQIANLTHTMNIFLH